MARPDTGCLARALHGKQSGAPSEAAWAVRLEVQGGGTCRLRRRNRFRPRPWDAAHDPHSRPRPSQQQRGRQHPLLARAQAGPCASRHPLRRLGACSGGQRDPRPSGRGFARHPCPGRCPRYPNRRGWPPLHGAKRQVRLRRPGCQSEPLRGELPLRLHQQRRLQPLLLPRRWHVRREECDAPAILLLRSCPGQPPPQAGARPNRLWSELEAPGQPSPRCPRWPLSPCGDRDPAPCQDGSLPQKQRGGHA